MADLLNSQLWPGDNHVLIDLVDAGWSSIVGPDLDVTATLHGADGAGTALARPEVIALPVTGRPVLRVEAPLSRPGGWTLRLTVDQGADTVDLDVPLTVFAETGTPAIGASAPAVETPVADDAADVRSVSSLDDPPLAPYSTSVQEALDAHRPFLLVIDSAVDPTLGTCGGGLAHVTHLAAEFPDLLVIHAEPWVAGDGSVALGSADRAAAAPWAIAWGATEPPWVFVVDGDGVLRAKFTGVMGSDELRDAVAAVRDD